MLVYWQLRTNAVFLEFAGFFGFFVFYFREISIRNVDKTHHTNILEKLRPNYVHILSDGKITENGDYSLAEKIEKNGFNKANKVSENK